MRNKKVTSDIGEVLSYATGLLVGDMCIRDLPQPWNEDEVESYREKWLHNLKRDEDSAAGQSAFNRGFDRALEPPLPKGKLGRRATDHALTVAEKVGAQASMMGRMLEVLGRMDPYMQREVIEACSRLMRDMDERLASVAGIPNLPG